MSEKEPTTFNQYFEGVRGGVVDLVEARRRRPIENTPTLNALNANLDLIKSFSKDIVSGHEGQDVLKIPLTRSAAERISLSTRSFLGISHLNESYLGTLSFEYLGPIGHKVRSMVIERGERRAVASWRNGLRINYISWLAENLRDGWTVVCEDGLSDIEALQISTLEKDKLLAKYSRFPLRIPPAMVGSLKQRFFGR